MPSSIRKVFFWTHLSIAVCAGAVILLMAATGLLLAFEAQIQGFADREARRVEPVAGSAAAAVESVLAGIAKERAELRVSSVTLRRDPAEAMSLALGRAGVLYVDPYRARVNGAGAAGVRRALRTVTDLHRYLAASGEKRAVGKAVTGVANVAFLVLLLSGMYLWIPRVLRSSAFRNALWFRRELTAKARDFNWHHVFGIWAVVPLVVVVVSATVMSFASVSSFVSSIGAPPEARGERTAAGGGARRADTKPSSPAGTSEAPELATLDLTGLDRALARARAEVPGWQSMTVRLPPAEDAITVSVDRATRRGRPDLRSQLVVDRATGEVREHEAFAEQSSGRRARAWMRWLHTGEAGGLAGQLVAAFACAAVLLLGWTGFALAWRRFLAWRRRDAAVRVRAGAEAGEVVALSPEIVSEGGP